MSNITEWPPDDATVGLIVFQAIVGVICMLMTFLLVGSFGNRVLWLIQLSHFLAWSLLLWGGRSWRVTVVLESYALVSALILTILGDLVTLLCFPYSLIPIAVLLKTLRTKRARATVAVVSILLFLIPLGQASLLPNARISFMQTPTILELLASSAVLAILTVVFALRPRRFTAGMALRVAAGASLYAVLDAFLHVLNPMPCFQLNRQWPLEGVWLCFWPSAAVAMLSGYAWGARVGFLTGLLGSAISDALLSRGLWLNWEIGVGLLGLVPGIFKARTGEKRGKSSVVLYVAIVAASAAGMGFATYVGCIFRYIFRYSGLGLGEATNAFFISTFFNAVVNGVTLASPILLTRYFFEARSHVPADLFEAVKRGDTAKVKELLEKGVNVNARDKDNSTPLHLATSVEVAELLIKYGADVNARDKDGFTPLHIAASNGKAGVAELLIRNGADVNAKSNDGSTPLHIAAYRGRAKVAEPMISSVRARYAVDLNIRGFHDKTPLHHVAYRGYADVAELLIEHGADLNSRDKDGWTPLHFAAQEGHAEVVRLLLEKGADMNARNNENKTPLDIAREEGQGEVARIIEEFIGSRLAILGVEASELHVGEWGRVIVRARGMGEARISIEGDAEFEAPSSLKLRGEKDIEVLVKPSAAGEVPIKITLETLGIKVTKMFTLKVKFKVEFVIKFLVGRRVELGQLAEECRGRWRPLRRPLRLRGLTCKSLLGQGGFATVVVCDDEFGVSYAVKMPTQVYTELTSVRGGAPTQVNVDLKPFLREVEVLRSVSGHPCIVGFHDFIDSPPALVFELCRCSLRDVLKRGGLGPVKAAEVLIQIADALAFLHSKGYVHGDVKPENILFSFEGVPKLSDFNTAKALATVSKTKPGYTPGYAAPEQLGMEEKVAEKADSWALGLVLYEAVTGKPLLPLDDLGYREAVARLEKEKLTFESTGIREIDELVESCLKVNPAERPSAQQIRDTLAKFLVARI